MTFEKKPSTTEDEYFAREDAERLRKLHYEELKRLQQSEREALRKLHHGRCSECGALMVPEQAGVVPVLHCPACGGAVLSKTAREHIPTPEKSHKGVEAGPNWFQTGKQT